MRMTPTIVRLLQAFLLDPSAAHYGYDLMRTAALKSGALYPSLGRLESQGWIRGSWESVDQSAAGRPARRYYVLTPEGEEAARLAVEAFLRDLRPVARPRPAMGV